MTLLDKIHNTKTNKLVNISCKTVLTNYIQTLNMTGGRAGRAD